MKPILIVSPEIGACAYAAKKVVAANAQAAEILVSFIEVSMEEWSLVVEREKFVRGKVDSFERAPLRRPGIHGAARTAMTPRPA